MPTSHWDRSSPWLSFFCFKPKAIIAKCCMLWSRGNARMRPSWWTAHRCYIQCEIRTIRRPASYLLFFFYKHSVIRYDKGKETCCESNEWKCEMVHNTPPRSLAEIAWKYPRQRRLNDPNVFIIPKESIIHFDFIFTWHPKQFTVTAIWLIF